jgi:hypothetical protein
MKRLLAGETTLLLPGANGEETQNNVKDEREREKDRELRLYSNQSIDCDRLRSEVVFGVNFVIRGNRALRDRRRFRILLLRERLALKRSLDLGGGVRSILLA